MPRGQKRLLEVTSFELSGHLQELELPRFRNRLVGDEAPRL